ncbi:MAG: adenylyl-sulfate kinase [Deltaproteobacteria bacterium]|nr:adenylyl-sulfate kinase [Deltaproteobacteria bacterium]
MNERNLTQQVGMVSKRDREQVLGQNGAVIWLTGLSGSGKSSIAYGLERRLVDEGRAAFVLDGDNLRHGLCADLGFSPEDRQENIRRVGEVAVLMAEAGLLVMASFISPYRCDRQSVRDQLPPGRFVEVFVDAPLSLCEERDAKGLYARARSGELVEFTGISAPYEGPETPELHLNTDELDIAACVERLWAYLQSVGLFKAEGGSA